MVFQGVKSDFNMVDEDFQASSSDEGSPSETDSSGSGAESASDASGDEVVRKSAKGEKKKKPAKRQENDRQTSTKLKKEVTTKPKADNDGIMDIDLQSMPKVKPKKTEHAAEEGPPKKKVKNV